MITGEVINVTLIKKLTNDIDYCGIQIGFDSHKIFYSYTKLLEFLNKQVSYDVVPDIFEGQHITVVANLAEIYKIQALEKNKDIRLVPKDAKVRIGCNFDCRTLKMGDTKLAAVAYLSKAEAGSSVRSEWYDLTCIDMNARVFAVRIFTRGADVDGLNIDEVVTSKVGKYVEMDITSTKYGLQTSSLKALELPVVAPPEVETAISIILSVANEDADLMDYMTKYDFINQLKSVIDMEPGYHLVRIASELSLINAVENISNMYDFQLMKRAAITSRGYLLPAKTKFSRPLLNVTKLMKTALGTNRELLLILDPVSEEPASPTKNAYMKIAQFSEAIIRERRGIDEKISDTINIESLRDITGGLL